jgi:hypothetical protein
MNSNNVTLVLPKVYIGNIKHNIDLSLIENASITHILTLSNETIDFTNKNELEFINKLVYDHDSFEIFEIFNDCFKFIDVATTSEHSLLINSYVLVLFFYLVWN